MINRNNLFLFGTIIIVILVLIILILPNNLQQMSKTETAGQEEEEQTLQDQEKTNLEEYNIETYAASMQPGWNLGNTFDGFDTGRAVIDETAWGNPLVTEELINSIVEQGFKSIRIPITFETRTDEKENYQINEYFLNRLKQAVDWSLAADLKVMINIHHDSWQSIANGMPTDHDNTVNRFKAIWTQLADTFKDYPIDLMFESLNEPQFHGSGGEVEGQKFLDELNTSFYTIIRNSGGYNKIRPLVIPTLLTNFEKQVHVDNLYNWIVETNDPYLIATVHYYGFWPFSVNIAGVSSFNKETKQHVIENFDRVHDKFVKSHIPVVIGEFGLLGFDTHTGTIQQGEKMKFFEFVIHYANEKNLVHMLWDNGQHFNRTTYKWSDPQLYEMMKASWQGRSATADTNFIYLKKGEEIKDITKILQLNGTEFIALQKDGVDLVLGEDYQIEGENLVIKKSLLSNSSDEVLTAKFSSGANWYIYIHTYDEPVFEEAEGTIHNFEIPVHFNGAHVQTMEAVYKDNGSNAGPQNWTSYKEFGKTFNPIYERNVVAFPDGANQFFSEVEDGREIELTFYFWSGEKMKYTITKSGDQVVGTALHN